MNRIALATITGLVLGLALVFGSFGDMLIVACSARSATSPPRSSMATSTLSRSRRGR